MKRIILSTLLIAIIILTTACGSGGKSSKPKSQREEKGLSADITNVRTIAYKAQDSFGSIEKTEFESDILSVFDAEGNIEEDYEFNRHGEPVFKAWREKDKYIDTGIRINPYNGYLESNYAYENDSNGNIISFSMFSPRGNLTYKHTNTYDGKGNLLGTIYYSSDGTISSKIFYYYDENNRLIEEKKIDSDGRQAYRDEYTYDNKDDKVSSKLRYDKNDTPIVRREYSYDSWGNRVVELVSSSDVSNRFDTYIKYDKNGNWYSKTTKRNGVTTGVVERKFNTDIPESLKNFQNTVVPSPYDS